MTKNHIILLYYEKEFRALIKVEQIKQKVSEAIQQSSLTQTAIAQALNMSQSTIAHYVKGDILPSLDTFANLCKILDVDTNYILCQL